MSVTPTHPSFENLARALRVRYPRFLGHAAMTLPRQDMRVWAMIATLLATFPWAAANAQSVSDELFERRVRPLLAKHCVTCHNSAQKSGGVVLEKALPAGVANQLLAAVDGSGKVAMPPTGPLPAADIETIRVWVKAGAPWPKKSPKAAPSKTVPHWSFAPLPKDVSQVPAGRPQAKSNVHPVDSALQKATGRPAQPPADRRTLLRRLSYTLTGLPPTPAETAAFVADRRPDAYERQVDRLLASPRYGEKWGRKWLDIVRYADTAGENSDHPVVDAWRYRNWVIDAFNKNTPYDEFIRLQIAGDLLRKDSSDAAYAEGIVATGFLAIARRFGHEIEQDHHLTLEDTIDTFGKAVLGLTVGCARCHDHKFEPISQRDYYALYGIFDSTKYPFPGCEPQQQPRDMVPLVHPARKAIVDAERKRRLDNWQRRMDASTAKQAGLLAQWSSALADPVQRVGNGDVPDNMSVPLVAGSTVRPISLRRGDSLVLVVGPKSGHGADTTRLKLNIAENSGQRRRWSTDALIDRLPGNVPVVEADGSRWAFVDLQATPRLLPERLDGIDGKSDLVGWRHTETPSVFANRSVQPVTAWTVLAPRSLFVHPGAKGPVGVVWSAPADMDVVVDGEIGDVHAYGDGVDWKLVRVPSNRVDNVDALTAWLESERGMVELAGERQAHETWGMDFAYAVREGAAHDVRLHRKGDPADLGETVPRGWLTVLGGQPVQERAGSGRAELAEWVFGSARGLAARVWANRIWQGHFGKGIVATPNDFGVRGAAPLSRELLDMLAAHLVRANWDTKALHRLVLTSAAWKAVTVEGPADAALGWVARRRLEAEEIRDTLLMVSGELDATRGGSHPFPPTSTWSFSQHAPFTAEYETNRRTVYVMQKRNRALPFLALFDGPDPNASTAIRDETNVPTQALWFLNNPFALACSRSVGAAVAAVPAENRITHLWRTVLGRRPTLGERIFAQKHCDSSTGISETERWASLARVLFASNEFLYVD